MTSSSGGGEEIAHHITTGPLRFLGFAASLHHWYFQFDHSDQIRIERLFPHVHLKSEETQNQTAIERKGIETNIRKKNT